VNRVDRVMYMTVVDIVATFDDDVKLSNDMKGVLGCHFLSIGVKSPSTTPMNLLSAITGVELNLLYPFAAPVFILTLPY
jgi:cytochrome c oxidase assembly factor CtaG